MRVASVQLDSNGGETRAARFERADAYLRQIEGESARPALVLFPELWATGFVNFENYRAEAEPLHGETHDRMSAWARRLGCYLLSGSFVERDGDDYYNTNLFFTPTGTLLGFYRKMHLFPFTAPGKESEATILSPGRALSVLKTEFGPVALTTCYDLRFPELFRALGNLGAQYLLVSAAWPEPRLSHWRIFNEARAIENQCFLFSCNGTGTIGDVTLLGHSMFVEPWGDVLAEGDAGPAILSADIDPGALKKTRDAYPVLQSKVLV